MKIKSLLLFCFLIGFNLNGNCQSENLFIQTLDGLNGVTESIQKLWEAFSNIDNTINKNKIKTMAVDFHNDIVEVIAAKKSIINKIKNQPTDNVKLKKEIDSLKAGMNHLKSSIEKYQPLIKSVGMDAELISSKLTLEFSTKLDNLENLKFLMPNNQQRKEFFLTYLNSGVNILNGSLLMLEKLK